MRQSTALLRVQNLSKKFYHPRTVEVLKEISLEIYPEESVAIIGASGSGKSTLLQILGTLEEASSGEILFRGEALTAKLFPHLRNQEIGFVFQAGNLMEEATVIDNLLLKAKIGRAPVGEKSASYKEAKELLQKVALSHREDFLVKYLSGGEKQRVTIARALMNSPSLILADEPTGNLDKDRAESIQTLLLECCKERGASLIVVTHDLDFARRTDRTLHLSEGVLLSSEALSK